MAAKNSSTLDVSALLRAARSLIRLPENHLTVDYDEEADVLYINYGEPRTATHTREIKPGIAVRYRGSKVIGVTLLDASKR
jgi:uncharacterized protein YuzE